MTSDEIHSKVGAEVDKLLAAKDHSYAYLTGFLQSMYAGAIVSMSEFDRNQELQRLETLVEMYKKENDLAF